MTRFYLLFLSFFISSALIAQEHLSNKISPYYIIYTFQDIEELNSGLTSNGFPAAKAIFADAGLYKIKIDDVQYLKLNAIKADLAIDIYEDTPVVLRRIPDDPGTTNMWSIGAMNLDEAWNFEQDGKTDDGHQIVTAIIDTGVQLDHEDLEENIWVNEGEIPDNDIDDDNNGYIDDYNAYDFQRDIPYLNPNSTHGTAIAGIIGAVANNGTGVAGISWHTKMMNLGPANFPSDIIEALNYIHERRKLFNETGGEQGDFVVAVNCSWGWPDERASDKPHVCSTFTKLGEVGIISAVSVDNPIKDLDDFGDLPADCHSLNMISVTAVDEDLQINGGYGPEMVNIAAPGKNIFTTGPEGKYRNFAGTSAAAPHITGAVAFLYDIACDKLLEEAMTKPGQTASLIKDILLSNAQQVNTLKSRVKDGRFPDLEASANEIMSRCSNANVGKLNILNIFPNPVSSDTKIQIEITHPDFGTYKYDVFNSLGQLVDEVVVEANRESSVHQIDVSGYAAGIYFIRLYRCPGNDNPAISCHVGQYDKLSRYLKNTKVVERKFIVQ